MPECPAARQQNPDDPAAQTMIGPHFGLSRDYDQTIIFVAPYLLALLAALTAAVPGAAAWTADVLATLVDIDGVDVPAPPSQRHGYCTSRRRYGFPSRKLAAEHINAAGGLPVT